MSSFFAEFYIAFGIGLQYFCVAINIISSSRWSNQLKKKILFLLLQFHHSKSACHLAWSFDCFPRSDSISFLLQIIIKCKHKNQKRERERVRKIERPYSGNWMRFLFLNQRKTKFFLFMTMANTCDADCRLSQTFYKKTCRCISTCSIFIHFAAKYCESKNELKDRFM